MSVIDDVLERTCKNMIKTILLCLDNATKGTIYRIGRLPTLQAIRVTSGIRVEGTDEITWGLPSVSDYNFPGKSWEQYKDRPDRVLEAMGWCVEKQKSWTADNPYEDVRSVGKQLRGEIEDYYHMEPVLAKKSELYGGGLNALEYPLDWRGNPIWEDTDYVVVAVVKIHFLPNTIKRDDRSTKIIRELSRSLGTELLSLYLRENLSRAQKEFARQRLHSCEILAHELRNTLIRFAFIFSAINAQISVIREEWEKLLKEAFPNLEWKTSVLTRLNDLVRKHMPALNGGAPDLSVLAGDLLAEQEELSAMSLLPYHGEQWINNKVIPKWSRLLRESCVFEAERDEIHSLLERLKKSLLLGMDTQLLVRLVDLPEELREKWARLSYVYFTADKIPVLGEIIDLLEDPALPIPHKKQIAKALKSLRVLVEAVPEIEERANRIILSLRDGTLSDSDAMQDIERICRETVFSNVANDVQSLVPLVDQLWK